MPGGNDPRDPKKGALRKAVSLKTNAAGAGASLKDEDSQNLLNTDSNSDGTDSSDSK